MLLLWPSPTSTLPWDCIRALYEADWMPCLVCGNDSHIPEECPIPGTSVVGRVTLPDMVTAYLTRYQKKGQCYICKAYHIEGGKYGKHHTTTKSCLHSLLAQGSLQWDWKDSLLQRAEDHRKILRLPKPKRQWGPDGRPVVKKTPDQQYMVKALDEIF